MKRVKLDDKYVASVEEGTRARLDKLTKRGLDPAQIEALSNFSDRILTTLNAHKDPSSSHITTPPTTPNTKKTEEELSKRVEVMVEHLSMIVGRVLKHRSDTPQLLASIKPPPRKPMPTTEPAKTDNIKVDSILNSYVFSTKPLRANAVKPASLL